MWDDRQIRVWGGYELGFMSETSNDMVESRVTGQLTPSDRSDSSGQPTARHCNACGRVDG
ncbi:hypothetical protein GCM10009835_51570 [Planosporangium flavigriseum]|uniref:Uncharacterized protein n=1 Tax=Planosporangium flavigriseum TaxID=373681 RepID=A0A8J3PMR7_9ACTN|nr:hypothetical protein Pfl04_42450 [Planosporangium flavigriseum]